MFDEIGSEFWLGNTKKEDKGETPQWLSKFGDLTLTLSGRGAITLLLEQIKPKCRTVLLPSYICNSVILPFIKNGYVCYFYDINCELIPNHESISSYEDIGIFVHMGYFGFPTNANLEHIIRCFKKESTIILEDITHTLFSNYPRYRDNDFYIGSIRKWFGVPSGGFLSSSNIKIIDTKIENEAFIELRLEALIKKNEYVKIQDDNLKQLFLDKFMQAEQVLDNDILAYSMDDLSVNLTNNLNKKELVNQRRKNFEVLSDGLGCIRYLKPIFTNLAEGVCPMFYPVLVQSDREHIRNKLASSKVYCPIHWPIPDQVPNGNLQIYNSILSIPCDQRYNEDDMERIVSILKDIKH